MIPIAKPTFYGDEADAIQHALNSGWVSQGPLVQKFEDAIAQYTGAKHAVAMTSWTTAMHIGMILNGIGPNNDVMCPSYSFIATANVIRYVGATPQFVDIDPKTLNIDPLLAQLVIERDYFANSENELRHVQTGRILKAIQVVHQVGVPVDIDAFAALCDQYKLILLEDSACAIGSLYKNKPIGSSGFMGALSFHPRKVITTGEGGMLLTNDARQAERARMYRTHGMNLSDLARHGSASTTFEQYQVVGYNYKLTDLQAALGLKQLEHIDEMIDRRIQIGQRYHEAFRAIGELELIHPPGYVTRWNCQSYPIRLRRGDVNDRNVIMQRLQDQQISTRRGIPPIHQEPAYRVRVNLPNTESVSQRSLFLPIFPSMSDDDVERVINAVKQSLR